MRRLRKGLVLSFIALTACETTPEEERDGLIAVVGSTVILGSTADALVKKENPTRNYGTESLRVRTGSTDEIRSYLKFEIPAGATVARATLRLRCTDASPDGGQVFVTAANWTDSGITYNSAPAPVGAAVGTFGSVVAGTWEEVDVTAAVKASGAVAFMLRSTSTNSAFYDSRETASDPQLVLEVMDAGGDGDGEEPPPPGSSGSGILISSAEIATRPTSGAAWQNILAYAARDTTAPDLANQEDNTDAAVFANALVYKRTGNTQARDKVVNAIRKVMETENGGRTLALGRNLTAYIAAAQLVVLSSADDAAFRTWLNAVRRETLDGRTLIATHEERPNNWGTHAGAARIAAAIYLGDQAELDRAARVFHGFVGNRTVYAGFAFGDLAWQCDSARPVAINPKGCTKSGRNIDGVLPDDQRRAGGFTWPPPKENYVWEAMQGVVLQAHLLHRAGYPAFEWQDRAVLRAVRWLYDVNGYPAASDDTGTPWLIDAMYGTSYASNTANPSKNGVAFYDWLLKPH